MRANGIFARHGDFTTFLLKGMVVGLADYPSADGKTAGSCS
jgi:hypothetical protein